MKGFFQIWLIVGALVILIAGGAYYFGYDHGWEKSTNSQISQTPQPISPTPSPDASPAPTGAGETANWKTYTNTKAGYSIKYPDDYTLTVDNDLIYDGVPAVSIAPTTPTFPPSNYSISIATEKNSKNLSLSQPDKLFGIGPLIQYEKLPSNWNIKQTHLGDLPAVRVDHCCGGQYGIESEIKTIKGNLIYEIVVTPDYDPANTKQNDEFYKNLRNLNKKKDYENIISTFKFL